MAHDPSVRVTLRNAYINGLSLEVAAIKAGIPYRTARNWFKEAREAGDNWDSHQGATLLAAGGGMEQAIARMTAAIIRKGEATIEMLEAAPGLDPLVVTQAIASLADSLNKTANIARKGMPEADALANENATVKALADLFIRLHPKSADLMLAVVEAWANGQR